MMSVLSDTLAAVAESKYLIYGLVDPRTLMVRYVGKSSKGMKRPKMHRRESGHNQHKDRWLAQLRAAGLDFDIVVLQRSTQEELSNDEMWWIEYAKLSGWPLTNLTAGGEGGATFLGRTHSEEARAKISAARSGKPLSAEHRARLSEVRAGRKLSDETRAKMREAHKDDGPSELCIAKAKAANTGRKKSSDEIAKMIKIGRRQSNLDHLAMVSAGNVGRKHSAETLAKLAGRKHSDEAIAKMKAAWQRRRESGVGNGVAGRKHSAETIAKMRAAQKRRRDAEKETA